MTAMTTEEIVKMIAISHPGKYSPATHARRTRRAWAPRKKRRFDVESLS